MSSISSDIQGNLAPQYNLPYRSGTGEKPYDLPRAPKNVNVTSPYLTGVLDIRWDNPADYYENNGLTVLGVNVYRTFDSPEATYAKISDVPVSSLFMRDTTREVRVTAEDSMPRLDAGTNPRNEWVLRTQFRPITVPGSQGTPAVNVADVLVEVDDGSGVYKPVVPWKVSGTTGEIFLNTGRTYDPATNRFNAPLLPNLLTGGVRVSYTHVPVVLAQNLNRKIYYKATTVALDEDRGITIETPLDQVASVSAQDIEKVDYIWAEAIRRNHWILEQGGERVKLLTRKWNGTPCPCTSSRYGTSKRSGVAGGCKLCYGTSFIGGYEGPYDMLIAPPESERSVNLMDTGLHLTYDWQSWTGPHLFLNDRDVVVRQDNMRFYIARPTAPGSRGAVFQQHFNMSAIDTTDAVYQVPITGGAYGTPDAWNAYRTARPSDAAPTIPEKPEAMPGAPTGRTVTFENIVL